MYLTPHKELYRGMILRDHLMEDKLVVLTLMLPKKIMILRRIGNLCKLTQDTETSL